MLTKKSFNSNFYRKSLFFKMATSSTIEIFLMSLRGFEAFCLSLVFILVHAGVHAHEGAFRSTSTASELLPWGRNETENDFAVTFLGAFVVYVNVAFILKSFFYNLKSDEENTLSTINIFDYKTYLDATLTVIGAFGFGTLTWLQISAVVGDEDALKRHFFDVVGIEPEDEALKVLTTMAVLVAILAVVFLMHFGLEVASIYFLYKADREMIKIFTGDKDFGVVERQLRGQIRELEKLLKATRMKRG